MSINKEMIKGLNEKDAALYLYDGFIKAIPPGFKDWSWYRWDRFEHEGDDIQIKLSSSGNEFSGNIDNFEFDFTLPQRGYYRTLYNRLPMPVYVSRRMDKQYHKLFHSSSMEMFCVPNNLLGQLPYVIQIREEIQKSLPRSRIWTLPNINEMFLEPVKHDIAQEISLISNKKVFCVDLDRKFCLSQGLADDVPLIWFHGQKIGKLKHEKEVKVTSKLFHQEAIDFFTPRGIEVTI
jgi:hypothetical protein